MNDTDFAIHQELRLAGVRDLYTRPEWACELHIITPGTASDILASCNDGNRRRRSTAIERYAEDMLNGAWRVNTNAIGFDRTGHLTNGQHRLEAVVKSGSTVCIPIMVGLEPLAYQTEDIGVTRTLGDVVPWMIGHGSKLTSCLSGMVSGPAMGWRLSHFPRSKQIEMANAARPAIEFTTSLFVANQKGFSRSGQMGAVACAYYHVDRGLLSDFVRRFIEDDQQGLPSMNPVRALRKWSISTMKTPSRNSGGVSGAALQSGDYSRAESCIAAFIRGDEVRQLKSSGTRRYIPTALAPWIGA